MHLPEAIGNGRARHNGPRQYCLRLFVVVDNGRRVYKISQPYADLTLVHSSSDTYASGGRE